MTPASIERALLVIQYRIIARSIGVPWSDVQATVSGKGTLPRDSARQRIELAIATMLGVPVGDLWPARYPSQPQRNATLQSLAASVRAATEAGIDPLRVIRRAIDDPHEALYAVLLAYAGELNTPNHCPHRGETVYANGEISYVPKHGAVTCPLCGPLPAPRATGGTARQSGHGSSHPRPDPREDRDAH